MEIGRLLEVGVGDDAGGEQDWRRRPWTRRRVAGEEGISAPGAPNATRAGSRGRGDSGEPGGGALIDGEGVGAAGCGEGRAAAHGCAGELNWSAMGI
jgi:hypothetical protein